MTRALVLGGGGVTGVAWEIGMLAGLHDAGVDLSTADLFVGTSAGSVVASMVASGLDIHDRYRAQLTGTTKEEFARLGPRQLVSYVWTMLGSRTPEQFGARIGAKSLRAATMPAADRRAVIESRLPVRDWPEARLQITAVNAHTGKFVVFDRDSGVALIDAISASCAVPLVWPPAVIGDDRYIDGGMRSAANVQLARGYDSVVVIAPITRGGGLLTAPARQVAQLRAEGANAVLLSPDEQARKAIGPNVLDPARRAVAAQAGLTQAASVADRVRATWG